MKKYLDLLAKKADHGELFTMDRRIQRIGFESGQIKEARLESRQGYAVRVAHKGKIGFSYGNDFNNVAEIIDNALLTARYSGEESFPFAPETNVPELTGPIFSQDIMDLTQQDMVALNEDMCQSLLRSDPDITPNSDVIKQWQSIQVMTTKGFAHTYERTVLELALGAGLIGENDIFQWYVQDASVKNDADITRMHALLKRDLDRSRTLVPSISGKLPVIMTPRFLDEVFGIFFSALNGEMIYRKTSPMRDKLNQPIFDPRISIHEDPAAAERIALIPFDHEGTPVAAKPIVEKGVLRNFLLTRKYAHLLGMEPTGNGYRSQFMKGLSVASQPSASSSVKVMSPGDTPLEAMLADIKQGVYCEMSPNIFMGNVLNGDFNGLLYLCYKIENGRLKGRMKNLTISGNIYDLMRHNVVALSKERECRYQSSHFHAPYAMVKDVTISG